VTLSQRYQLPPFARATAPCGLFAGLQTRHAAGRRFVGRAGYAAGLETCQYAVRGLVPTTLRFHKEDTCTKHNCPDGHVVKADIVKDLQALLKERHSGDHASPKELTHLGDWLNG
jgi:hypothetical protein